jgi:hypothetical protein
MTRMANRGTWLGPLACEEMVRFSTYVYGVFGLRFERFLSEACLSFAQRFGMSVEL